jgi:hypothetical protein
MVGINRFFDYEIFIYLEDLYLFGEVNDDGNDLIYAADG